MGWVWGVLGALFGAILGATIADDSTAILGLLGGAACGYLTWRSADLGARVRHIEKRLAQSGTLAMPTPVASPDPVAMPGAVLDLRSATPVITEAAEPFVIDSMPAVPPPPRVDAVWGETPRPVAAAEAEPYREDFGERLLGSIKSWFTEGNVPVKVGMLVLFAGVAALLKYAADEGWFTFPIEFRLTGIALASVAALVFAWRQRHAKRGFSLSLQGGAIGILLLTVFAAFRLYHLLPATAAFALMLVLVAGVCVLAVLQDALALAVLGILAGFAAPILISTGSGNHVVLFSYYALLNIAIFAIAWTRAWRILNLLGFFFTFAIGTIWGVLSYKPELFDSTEPFLLLYFAIYLAIPALYALKLGRERPDAVDGSLIFANPLIAFSLQAALLQGERIPLAISALVLGVIYIVLAWALIRRVRVLGEAYAVLALGFSTLAIPLALSARTTGCLFALEGAALLWLGLRQQRRLPRWIGLLLQVLAAGAFAFAWSPRPIEELPIANGAFVGAILIAAAALISAWLYQRARASSGLGLLLYLWGLAWWFGAWLIEIMRHVASTHELPAILGLIAGTAWLAAEAERAWRRLALAWTTAILFWLVVPTSILINTDNQLFSTWSLLAHLAFFVFGWRALLCLRGSADSAQTTAHLGWLWVWTLVAAMSLREFAIHSGLGNGWLVAMLGLPLLIAHLFVLRRPDWIAPPLSREFPRYRSAMLGSQLIVLGLLMTIGLFHPGDSAPLGFIPLFNPLELFQFAGLIALAIATRDEDASAFFRSHRPALLSFSGFVLITAATLRSAHHLGGIPWDGGLLSASLSQTSLAVVWSILGVAGWVIGSRRGNRPLWLASAVLMGVVLIKLLLIDRQHLGNLFGIASFIAYGLLCTLVGYLAPAPPRQNAQGDNA